MAREIEDETEWCECVAEAGLPWFAPLANSYRLEGRANLAGDDFIPIDLRIIEAMRPVVLMRPGWRAHDGLVESVGARAEYEHAKQLGLAIIDGHRLGRAGALSALARTAEAAGETE